MSMNHIVGLVIMAIGITLLCLGINASRSMGERMYEDLMSRTTWFDGGGVVAIVGGVGVMLLGGRRTTYPCSADTRAAEHTTR
jgi:hypothetical protein